MSLPRYLSLNRPRLCENPLGPPMTFSRQDGAQRATLDAVDLAEVQGCRRVHNQLGFAYQIHFVRLLNRFQKQQLSLLRHVSPIEWHNCRPVSPSSRV